ncbi:MAG: HAD-IB family phosphatase [Synergistaceae bacterium]|jgi:D-3-phosphoglycerate dehydrogenase|nr:HAD-IB family phosphatase [Synergistaceae bacterium]
MENKFSLPDMARQNSFIFDFDSTLVTIETLDTLIKQNLSGRENEDARRRIDEITARAMNGELDFSASLSERLRLSKARVEHFARMAAHIADFVTPGMSEVVKLLNQKRQKLFIISGGFLKIVRPIAELFGIPDDRRFANDYVADAEGRVVGVEDGPLAHEGGKSQLVRALKEQGWLTGTVVMLGDGMSDYQVYADGLADLFIGCGFNAARPNVEFLSPVFVKTVAELLELL